MQLIVSLASRERQRSPDALAAEELKLVRTTWTSKPIASYPPSHKRASNTVRDAARTDLQSLHAAVVQAQTKVSFENLQNLVFFSVFSDLSLTVSNVVFPQSAEFPSAV